MKHIGEASQSTKLNEEFRKQIRRRDIQRRLADKRKQFLQYQKNIITQEMHNQNQSSTQISSNKLINDKFQTISNNYLNNGNKLAIQDIKQLAKLSCSLAGSQIIAGSSQQFIMYLIEQFIFKQKYSQSQQLTWVLLIFNNCLTVSNSNYHESKNFNHAIFLNSVTTRQNFLLRLFDIALRSAKNSIKQNAMSIIFCIIYNNQPIFIQTLVTNPKYSIMSLFFNQMMTEPCQSVVFQTLRCYYLVIKKLEFGNYEQFAKMRKFIIIVIRNSNCLELIILGVVCLNSLLKSLPNQKVNVSNSGILKIILNQALSLNNQKLVVHSLRLSSYILGVNNQQDSKAILSFIQSALDKYGTYQFKIHTYKMVYDIVVNSSIQVEGFDKNYSKLFNRTMELFQSNLTEKDILIQVSFCLCVIAAKNKSMQASIVNRIRSRIKYIVANLELDQKSINFLEQSLFILNPNDEMIQL